MGEHQTFFQLPRSDFRSQNGSPWVSEDHKHQFQYSSLVERRPEPSMVSSSPEAWSNPPSGPPLAATVVTPPCPVISSEAPVVTPTSVSAWIQAPSVAGTPPLVSTSTAISPVVPPSTSAMAPILSLVSTSSVSTVVAKTMEIPAVVSTVIPTVTATTTVSPVTPTLIPSAVATPPSICKVDPAHTAIPTARATAPSISTVVTTPTTLLSAAVAQSLPAVVSTVPPVVVLNSSISTLVSAPTALHRALTTVVPPAVPRTVVEPLLAVASGTDKTPEGAQCVSECARPTPEDTVQEEGGSCEEKSPSPRPALPPVKVIKPCVVLLKRNQEAEAALEKHKNLLQTQQSPKPAKVSSRRNSRGSGNSRGSYEGAGTTFRRGSTETSSRGPPRFSATCHTCHKQLSSVLKLKEHLMHTHGLSAESLHTHPNGITCSTCGRHRRSLRALWKHVRLQHGGPRTCELCRAHFTSKAGIRQHLAQFHQQQLRGAPERGGLLVYCCPYCKSLHANKDRFKKHLGFITPSSFKQHEARVNAEVLSHQKEAIPCGVCGSRAANLAFLHAHQASHVELERPFVCRTPATPPCNKAFLFQCQLDRHQLIHQVGSIAARGLLQHQQSSGSSPGSCSSSTGSGRHRCPRCRKQARSGVRLASHAALCHRVGQPEHRCATCDVCFPSARSLDRHALKKGHEQPEQQQPPPQLPPADLDPWLVQHGITDIEGLCYDTAFSSSTEPPTAPSLVRPDSLGSSDSVSTSDAFSMYFQSLHSLGSLDLALDFEGNPPSAQPSALGPFGGELSCAELLLEHETLAPLQPKLVVPSRGEESSQDSSSSTHNPPRFHTLQTVPLEPLVDEFLTSTCSPHTAELFTKHTTELFAKHGPAGGLGPPLEDLEASFMPGVESALCKLEPGVIKSEFPGGIKPELPHLQSLLASPLASLHVAKPQPPATVSVMYLTPYVQPAPLEQALPVPPLNPPAVPAQPPVPLVPVVPQLVAPAPQQEVLHVPTLLQPGLGNPPELLTPAQDPLGEQLLLDVSNPGLGSIESPVPPTTPSPAPPVTPTPSTPGSSSGSSKMKPERCKECDKLFSSAHSAARHAKLSCPGRATATMQISCPLCSVVLLDRKELLRHRREQHPEALYTCGPSCGKSFQLAQSLARHQRTCPQSVSQAVLAPRAPAFPCRLCRGSWPTREELRRHMAEQHGTAVLCPVCQRYLATPQSLRRHIKSHHANELSSAYEGSQSPLPLTPSLEVPALPITIPVPPITVPLPPRAPHVSIPLPITVPVPPRALSAATVPLPAPHPPESDSPPKKKRKKKTKRERELEEQARQRDSKDKLLTTAATALKSPPMQVLRQGFNAKEVESSAGREDDDLSDLSSLTTSQLFNGDILVANGEVGVEGASGGSDEFLLSDMFLVRNGALQCDFCDASFPSDQLLLRHLATQHFPNTQWQPTASSGAQGSHLHPQEGPCDMPAI